MKQGQQQATAKPQSSQYLLRETNGQYKIIDYEEFLSITMQDLRIETKNKIINRVIELTANDLHTLAYLVDKLRQSASQKDDQLSFSMV